MRRINIVRTLGVLHAATAITGGASATPSQAGTDCGTGVYGGDVYWQARTASRDGRTVALWSGKAFDESHAEITRGYSPGVWDWRHWTYRDGDRAWVDRRSPGSSDWFQCGPFVSRRSHEMDNINYDMRACMDYRYGNGRRYICTDWYKDDPELVDPGDNLIFEFLWMVLPASVIRARQYS